MASTNLQSGTSGDKAELDDAERASRDEITALQVKRLAWTLAYGYDNVAHYKKRSTRPACVHAELITHHIKNTTGIHAASGR